MSDELAGVRAALPTVEQAIEGAVNCCRHELYCEMEDDHRAAINRVALAARMDEHDNWHGECDTRCRRWLELEADLRREMGDE